MTARLLVRLLPEGGELPAKARHVVRSVHPTLVRQLTEDDGLGAAHELNGDHFVTFLLSRPEVLVLAPRLNWACVATPTGLEPVSPP
jgi:hypothetical protein